MTRELGQYAKLLFAAAPVLLLQVIPQNCRCLLADTSVLPRIAILHQGAENCAVVVAIRVFRPEAPLMSDQHSAVVAQEISFVNIDAKERLLVAVLRPDGVPRKTEFPLAVCLEAFIAAASIHVKLYLTEPHLSRARLPDEFLRYARLLFLPDMLVLRQPLQCLRLVRVQLQRHRCFTKGVSEKSSY